MIGSVDECTPCVGGEYCETDGLSVPTGLCEPGYYCGQGSNTATPDDGQQSLAYLGETCADQSGADDNSVCPRGHYCPEGTTSPIQCPSGKMSSALGQYNVSQCEDCEAPRRLSWRRVLFSNELDCEEKDSNELDCEDTRRSGGILLPAEWHDQCDGGMQLWVLLSWWRRNAHTRLYAWALLRRQGQGAQPVCCRQLPERHGPSVVPHVPRRSTPCVFFVGSKYVRAWNKKAR